jgi:hypothetical protein
MTTVSGHHVFRFNVTSASFIAITVKDILGAIGGVALTTTTFTPFASAFKLHRVSIWPSVGSGESSPQLSWAAGTASQVPDEARVDTIPSGVTVSRALHFRPPAASLASFWITSVNSSSSVFVVVAPVGSILDLEVSFRLANVVAPLTPITIIAGTAGSVYYLPLDGTAGGYTPIGLPTIT